MLRSAQHDKFLRTLLPLLALCGVELLDEPIYGLQGAVLPYLKTDLALSYPEVGLLLTGDQTACAQAKELLGADLETVAVKEATGHVAARKFSSDQGSRVDARMPPRAPSKRSARRRIYA